MQLHRLVKYMSDYFSLSSFPDVDSSQNGLQVDAGAGVTKITTAVDACMDTFKAAAGAGSELLIVHHGLFWGKSLTVTGVHGKRIAYLIKNGISLYAMHLPLDMHPELGNNVRLARVLGLEILGGFGKYRGQEIGIEAKVRAMSREAFAEKVESALKAGARLLPFGPEKVKRVAIVSGSGTSEIQQAAFQEFDLILTGEGGHSVFHLAKEHAINVLYAGHYATETLGVKALGEHLAEKFGLTHAFLDMPTGF